MYRFYPYLMLFAAAVLLQIFLFDNLSISLYVTPLIYVAFIVLLPLDTPAAVLLGAGLAMGLTMDCAMGAAGINTIATLLIAFLRPWILSMFCGRDNSREGGTPSPERMGRITFLKYLVVVVLIHHAVFFFLESLSLTHVFHTLLRIFASGILTVAAVWLVMRIFTAKLPIRI